MTVNRTATLYLGDGTGGFAKRDAGLTGVEFGSSTLGDVDGDGNLDLVITGEDENFEQSARLYLGDGTGGFSEANAGLTGVQFSSSTLGDVDGDGNQDLVITGSGTATLYLGDGTGGFTKQDAGLAGVGDGSSTLGDLDNDGNQDLVVTGSGTATLYENLATGNFRVASSEKTVSSDGTASFGDTGAAITFAGTDGSGDVTVQRFSNAPTNPLGIETANVGNYRFVISAAGDLTFADSTELRLDVSTLDGISNASNVTVYRRSPRGTGVFDSLPTTYDSGSNELVAETGAFSEFALGSNTEPLPVELASFEANTSGEAAALTWTTASETNNAGFAVQHRADSTAAWQALGFVESRATGGTATEAREYRFRAEGLDVGTHQFRLKQVDTDGSVHYSKAIEASVRMQKAYRLTTYPNPVRQQATVAVAVREEQSVTLRLYDVLGRGVATLHDGELPAQETRTLSLQARTLGLSSGTYFLRLRGAEGTRTRRVTIVR